MNQQYTARTWRSRYLDDFAWNDYQKEIFRYLQSPDVSHVQVCAVAGSGKTTTIFGIVAALPASARILICAFNKHIAEKIASDPRIPKGRVRASTAHAVGYGLLTNYFAGFQPLLEDNKYYQLAKKLYQYHSQIEHCDRELPFPWFNERIPKEREELRELCTFVRDVVEFSMLTLTSPDIKSLMEMVDYYGLEESLKKETKFWGCTLAIEALKLGERIAAYEHKITYTEMLYLPYKWDIAVSKKDWLIVDEAQDANAAQRALYRKYVDAGARAIFIGDDRQAIQGFAGADAYSWQKLKQEFGTIDKPLHLCYRCPTSHLELAQKIVPIITSPPEAPAGKTEVIQIERVLEVAEAGDLIICRLNAPLIQLCLKLIVRGKYAKVRGRKLGQQLVSLAQKAVDESQYQSFLSHLLAYCAPQIQQFLNDGDEERAEALTDRQEALTYCYESFGSECRSLAEFCQRVEALFSDEYRGIVLSTIHRAKGDEANRVFLLGSNLLPFLMTSKQIQPWQIQQEWNLVYVALTRAKQDLYFVPILRGADTPTMLLANLNSPLGGLRLLPNEDSRATQNDCNLIFQSSHP